MQFEAIADGLADHGFAIIDDFLTAQEVNDILDEPLFKNPALLKKAGVGKEYQLQINESIRGDHILWLDKHTAPPAVLTYLTRLEELYQYLNRSLFLSLKDCEVHFTSYPAGAFYKRHLDQFKKDDHRILSVICYLNNDWTESNGGELRIFGEEGEPQNVLPISGRLVCFRSDQLEHEVLPSNRERLSLTGWILDRYADIQV